MVDSTARFRILLVTVTLIGHVGCDSTVRTYPVHGRVIFPNGVPLTFGTIEFESLDVDPPVTASGQIGGDGYFSLGTYALNDGALPGRHRAAVIADVQISNGWERPDRIPEEAVDRRFRDFQTSGLEFEVVEKANNIQVIVKPPAANH